MRITGSLLRQYDVVVFGATGFTGKHVAKYIASNHGNISWAVAGRSLEGLKQVSPSPNVTSIVADIKDLDSLRKMASQSKVVINCAGPFSELGEPVVRSCLDTKTHCLDVSGEPYFLEKIHDKYFDEAKSLNTLVVGAAGFDSVPADLGVVLLRKAFPDVKSIETFLEVISEKHQIKGNYATWMSLINGYANLTSLRRVRRNIFKDHAKEFAEQSKLLKRKAFQVRKSNYVVPFNGSCRSVLKRSQLLNLVYRNEKPIPLETYFIFSRLKRLLGAGLVALSIGSLNGNDWGRQLLAKHSNFFSLGTFPKDSVPDLDVLNDTRFRMEIEGTRQDGSKARLVINGPDPGYATAAICVVESALTLLQELDTLPLKGGVVTPGFLFADTALHKRLQSNGITFTLE